MARNARNGEFFSIFVPSAMSPKAKRISAVVALILIALPVVIYCSRKEFLRKTPLKNFLYGYAAGPTAACDQFIASDFVSNFSRAGCKSALRNALLAYQGTVKHCLSKKDTSCAKFFVFHGENGYGNRLPGMVFTFALSLLFDRVMLMDFPPDEPRFSELWDSEYILEYDEWKAVNGFDSLPSASYRFQTNEDARAMDPLFQSDLAQFFAPHDVVHVRSTDNPFPVLFMNAIHHPQFQALFCEFGSFYDGIYSWLLREILKPGPAVMSKVKAFRSKDFGKKTIGLQVRAKKRVEFDFDGDGSKTFLLARMLRDQQYQTDADVRYFLATDSRWVRDACRLYFGDACIFYPEFGLDNVAMTQDVSRVPENYLLSAIDIVLLSTCDDIVTTYASTYGVTAAALGGIIPYRVGPGKLYMYHVTAEPCFWGYRQFFSHLEYDDSRIYGLCNPYFLYHAECSAP
mmetsp:Transcript_27998/g.45457  ORF Transcript_27998/g.45457 Transcript_27998/m.45457 type:complete len:458 (+) Transcript_27998:52-1425(+)